MKKFDLFIFAGETSGDIHGNHILKHLNREYPQIKIIGVGGPKMRENAFTSFMPMEKFQVMGFTAVIKALPQLFINFFKIKRFILKNNPKGVVFIDYPGFNLKMAQHLRKSGYKGKIIHYICPTVWAHGSHRIEILAKNLDLLLTIFPFEKKYFDHTSLKVSYIGHPLLEIIKKEDQLPLKSLSKRKCIGIFPGSRQAEIDQNLPKLLQAADLLKIKDPSLIFALSVASKKLIEKIHLYLKETSLVLEKDIFLIQGDQRYQMMYSIDLAMATSGTITLELGARKIPTVVVYHVSFINFLFAKYILKLNLPYYCIVNIIQEKMVFQELIHKNFTSKKLYEKMLDLIRSEEEKNHCVNELTKMIEKMQTNLSPSKKTASEIAYEIL